MAATPEEPWLNLEYTCHSGNLVVPCVTIGSVRIRDSSSWGVTQRHIVLEYFESRGKRAGSRTRLQARHVA